MEGIRRREERDKGGGRKRIRYREKRERNERRGARDLENIGRETSVASFVPGGVSTQDKRSPLVPGGGSPRDKKGRGAFCLGWSHQPG